MRTPKTTKEINNLFGENLTFENIESQTCSIKCNHCDGKIWFIGNLYDDTIPANFNCPYCHAVTVNKCKVFELYKNSR